MQIRSDVRGLLKEHFSVELLLVQQPPFIRRENAEVPENSSFGKFGPWRKLSQKYAMAFCDCMGIAACGGVSRHEETLELESDQLFLRKWLL